MKEDTEALVRGTEGVGARGESNQFMRYIGEVWRCGNLYRTARYEALDIGSYQDSYLVNVCRRPGITQEELARRIYVHKSNVARQLSALEEKGFVERRTDPEDRRSLRIFPTEKAVKALPQIEAVRQSWEAAVLEGLDEEERTLLDRCLCRLAENAKAVVRGDRP